MGKTAVLWIGLAGLIGCSVGAYQRGSALARRGDWAAAIEQLEIAASEDPDNIEVRIALIRTRLEAHAFHSRRAQDRLAAGDLGAAVRDLELALAYEPSSPHTRDELRDVRQRLESPGEQPAPVSRRAFPPARERVIDPASDAPLNLKFAEDTSLRKIFETLAKLAGINFLFDESFRDKRVTVDLEGVTFQQALDLLTRTNGLFYKVVGPALVTIGPGGER